MNTHTCSLRRKLSLDTFSLSGVFDQTLVHQLYVVCGLTAGSIAAVITQPADVVKTYMQMDSKNHKRIMSTIRYIYKVPPPSLFIKVCHTYIRVSVWPNFLQQNNLVYWLKGILIFRQMDTKAFLRASFQGPFEELRPQPFLGLCMKR